MLVQPNRPALPTVNASAVSDLAPQALAQRLPPLLSVIAGMVDLTGFLTLGNVFTAHITGNLVLVAAVLVRGRPANVAQVLAIPVFMLAVAGAWLIARRVSNRGASVL